MTSTSDSTLPKIRSESVELPPIQFRRASLSSDQQHVHLERNVAFSRHPGQYPTHPDTTRHRWEKDEQDEIIKRGQSLPQWGAEEIELMRRLHIDRLRLSSQRLLHPIEDDRNVQDKESPSISRTSSIASTRSNGSRSNRTSMIGKIDLTKYLTAPKVSAKFMDIQRRLDLILNFSQPHTTDERPASPRARERA